MKERKGKKEKGGKLSNIGQISKEIVIVSARPILPKDRRPCNKIARYWLQLKTDANVQCKSGCGKENREKKINIRISRALGTRTVFLERHQVRSTDKNMYIFNGLFEMNMRE
jgi:hypothetical protein